ncbi:RagB/SusD family nutrient uptake outer membrane protein [Wenyingzhuangia sp. 2_MG-2023]|uniref:RagB/SusD family nutrient uptake outer membrane protein n=1 Tax=Wenyingzhuangia sp. 2_MG-2023 TaxID=3062639 RepID=UPI0026E2BBE0|nr:RagB/SusD family nutrient uptake outer membrane protein [Wenyingzhuangia sp. 2_MG-2023]MDO6736841.1 RagB/SusD family nutrient uptake outer membrane protein [Wenyingzhuangia sp. 2_MG-2023]
MYLKQIFIYSLTILFCTACTDELDQYPETSIVADNYYTTEENVESTVTATYNSLQELYDYYMILFGEIPSDNTYVQAPNSNTGVSSLEDFTWTSTTGFTNSIWENAYEGVLYANTVLEFIDDTTYESESIKTIRKGEVTFLRGFLYHLLTSIYGDVPLVISIGNPSDAFDDTRTPLEEVNAQIEKDLLEAIALLPQVNSTGRVDRNAAKAILAKHYLNNQDYTNAEIQLQSIVTSGQYSLVDFGDLYGVDNEGNSEDIFSVQFASELDDKSEGSSYYYSFTQPDNEGGKGAMAMEKSLYDLYDVNDLRRTLINESGNTYYINKWTPSPNTSVGDAGDNHYIVRYADILLLYAECLNENSKTSEAITYLNVVRNRAGLTNTIANNQASVRDAIALERRLELVGEGHRWFDLLRTNKAKETMDTFFESQSRSTVVESFRLLAPVPQSQIDITEMEQNPKY